jgi:hypothetical protein
LKANYWNDNALYIASIGKFEVRNTLPNGTPLPLYVPWGYTHTGSIWKVTSNTTKLLPPIDAPIYYRCMFLSIIGIVVVRYEENINENSNTNGSPFENNCLPRTIGHLG